MRALYIYGTGGHGGVLADIAHLRGYDEVIFLDDENPDFPNLEDIGKRQDIPVALAIESNHRRKVLFQKLKSMGLKIETLIHPSAIISKSAKIEEGCAVMAGVIINHGAILEKGVIVNSGSIVEYKSTLKEFSNIAPRVAIARNVVVESLTHIGIGSSIIQDIKIGSESIIGAGSVVVSDILSNVVAYGVPCKMQKKRN
ncbi:MAG: acetyltransferase [Sulfurospirillaceae bacterium]|jgi:UDP-N-acetylbacillosamine N-acetyltransferase|nr:acetyltransferase [Sulfurospirillaceae bacterium]MCK9545836.1 acetyltransferase [Sulfurospirillaceae bacterium]MDY0238561.1 acetyltransferase [Campylobacterales bacterium]NLM98732.1 acetyltransferase [Campylobacteraceae bacterium]